MNNCVSLRPEIKIIENMKKILTASCLMMAMTAMGQNFTQNLDPTVRPGDDFFQYAAGGWMKAG